MLAKLSLPEMTSKARLRLRNHLPSLCIVDYRSEAAGQSFLTIRDEGEREREDMMSRNKERGSIGCRGGTLRE